MNKFHYIIIIIIIADDQHVDERLLVNWKRLLPGKGSVDIEGGAQNEKIVLHKQASCCTALQPVAKNYLINLIFIY